MALRFASITVVSHDGLVRDHNEDSTVVGPWTTCATSTPAPQTFMLPLRDPVVVAVADGLGGHPSGDVASSVVAQTLARVGTALGDEKSVRQAVDLCNQRVFDAGAVDPARLGMGTTVAGVVLGDGSALVFNVGDSRVYVHGPDGLTQLSVDDSPPLLPGETHTVVVTQILGGFGAAERLDSHVFRRPFDEGEQLLICSDGLSDVLADPEIEGVLGGQHGAKAVFELWKAAINGGGPDNITIALVEIVTPSGPPS